VLAKLVEKLARGVRSPLERQGEAGDPLIVVDELILACISVVDPVDMLGLQVRVVLAGRSDEVPTAARFVQIVVEVCACRHEAIDIAVGQQVRDQETHAAGAQRAGHAEENRTVRPEHLFPDPPRRGEAASLERDTFHPREHLVSAQPRLDRERFHGDAKEARLRRHDEL
jgi:hypothetical protein